MKIAIVGKGAIAGYLRRALDPKVAEVAAIIVRPERLRDRPDGDPVWRSSIADLPAGVSLVVDCAGHSGLKAHGVTALSQGLDVATLSLGALADRSLADALNTAAQTGNSRLHLASGAIGALDVLRAARVGGLGKVTYTGRKPPMGWKGSPAETILDLDNLGGTAATHFTGSARQAALQYPKNANVAAAVALAGAGFDETQVALIADPNVSSNIHEITAEGAFGSFRFSVSGNSLPDNPRSSALAAMSIVATVAEQRSRIRFG